jgi:hypothetical protein
MNAGEGKQTGDVVSAKKGSAQEEYYKYMLLKEKLKQSGEGTGDGGFKHPLLQVQSEREGIEMQILKKLINITESSPEFSQVADITGSRDRYEQARILSEVVYDKVRAEAILGFYTPDKDALQSPFVERTVRASVGRSTQLAKLASEEQKASLFGSVLGGGASSAASAPK